VKIVYLPVTLSTTKPFPLCAASLLISNNYHGLPCISSKTSNKDTNYSSFLGCLQPDKKFSDVKGCCCSLHNCGLTFFLWEHFSTAQSLYFSQIKASSRIKIHSPFCKELLQFCALRLLVRNTRRGFVRL